MRHLITRTSGQSTAEYAIVIALVLGALVGMQTYLRRSLNARIANATDTRLPRAGMNATTDGQDAGTNANFPVMFGQFNRGQFEPYYAKSDTTTTSNTDTVGVGYQVTGSAGTPSTVAGSATSVTKREGSSEETGYLN